MSTQNVLEETENLIYFASFLLRSYLNNESSPSKIDSNRVIWIPSEMTSYLESTSSLSPVDFVADLQRRYISMHPFGEGNGRTSHFLQDFILDSLGLPFAPTGRLVHELIYPIEEYRALTWKEILGTLTRLENCLEQYDLHQAGKGEISKTCQPICRTKQGSHSLPTLACGAKGTILTCEDLQTQSF